MLRIEVVWGRGPGQIDRVALQLPEGASVADGLRARGVQVGFGPVGVVVRGQPLQALLGGREVVEIYRPLKVDPKEARRLRYKRTKQAAG